GTAHELPVIADVDGDGHADILIGSNNLPSPGLVGLQLYSDPGWVPTRRIWNQHTYHITNVSDDGTIPAHEANSWTKYNSYRQNRLTSGCEFAKPDLIPSFVRRVRSGANFVLTARIGNAGGSPVAAGLPVSFYGGDPSAGGALLGTVTTARALPSGAFLDVSLSVAAST